MKIELALLNDYENLFDFLQSLGLSRQYLKKFKISKNDPKKIVSGDLLSLPIDLMNTGLINPLYKGQKIEVLNENEDWICLSKPPQIHCHPLSYSENDNVLSFLRANSLFKPLLVNQSHYDRGLLYRLDYETSGVLFLAKGEQLYKDIRKDWSNIQKKKTYLAIVEGKLEKKQTLEAALTTSGQKIKVQSDSLKNAHLDVDPLAYEEQNNLSLVRIELFEGLRHQIRVQLSHAGYPILGDTLYGGQSSQRLFLHAYSYEFILCDGRSLRARDISAVLFRKFFDLDRYLEVLGD